MTLISTAEIQHLVAAHYNADPRCMTAFSRKRAAVRPRQIAMWLSRKVASPSYAAIGRRFGGRDQSTASHGVRQVDRLIQRDAEVRYDVEEIAQLVASLITLRAALRAQMTLHWGQP